MRLSEHQLIHLLSVLKESCKIAGTFGGLTAESRLNLYNQIISNQCDILETKENKDEDGYE